MRAATGAACIALLLAAPAGFSQGADDAEVKTRVAIAIARFAELPAQRGSHSLQWCVAVGEEPAPAFLGLADRKVGTLALQLHLGPPFAACDVLYIDSSFKQWRSLLADPRAPVLTVGDMPGFLAAGGMVELVIENDAVRFDVNLRALRSHAIRLPPQVLSLARQVRD